MEYFERLAGLRREHAAFAVATVVARRSPVSSHLGDRAVIFADGRMEGFVGGSCARDHVRRHALAAMQSGRPRLLQIRPEAMSAERADGDDAERLVVPMDCSSEGAVDVYVEPYVAPRSLVVAGFTPVADALARLAASLDYDVVRSVDDVELQDVEPLERVRVVALDGLRPYLDGLTPAQRGRLVAVVASQGHYDEAALEVILDAGAAFVGLLASRKRAAKVRGVLAQQGVSAERLATIRTPVGLDIGARSPGEVAISILAEVISTTPTVADLAGERETMGV
jgi:xanthine dehydrogenase accessory factor